MGEARDVLYINTIKQRQRRYSALELAGVEMLFSIDLDELLEAPRRAGKSQILWTTDRHHGTITIEAGPLPDLEA